MSKVMLVNPSPRKRHHTGHRRKGHRTAAQKAATRKMIAARRRMEHNPSKRRKRVHHTKATHRRHHYKDNPVRRRRHYKRNPAMKLNMKSIMNAQIMPAAIMAMGGLGLDVVFGYIADKLPASLTSHPMVKNATKGVLAIGLAMLAENVVKRDTANKLALGGLTIVLHDTLKSTLSSMAPSIPMDGVGWMSPAYGVGYYEMINQPQATLPASPGTHGLGYYEHTGSLGAAEYDWASGDF